MGERISLIQQEAEALTGRAIEFLTRVARSELAAGHGVLDVSHAGDRHDLAPGAALVFHTAEGGQANFARGILALHAAGAKVIVDDVIYLAEPMFQDGIVAQAVDRVAARGTAFFSAAGNDGRQSYERRFRNSRRSWG